MLDNHKSVLNSFGIPTNDAELDFPCIYWNLKNDAQKSQQTHFNAGPSKCSTKPLSVLLTKLLPHIKQSLQKYCETAFWRSWINHMLIFENSKILVEHLKSPNLTLSRNQILRFFDNTFTQPLKSRLETIIRNSFIHKYGNRRYTYFVLGREGISPLKEHSDSKRSILKMT